MVGLRAADSYLGLRAGDTGMADSETRHGAQHVGYVTGLPAFDICSRNNGDGTANVRNRNGRTRTRHNDLVELLIGGAGNGHGKTGGKRCQ